MFLQTINTRNLRYLHRIQIVFISLLFAVGLFGQNVNKKGANFNRFKAKPVYYGITFGLNNTGYKVFKSGDFLLNDSISIVDGSSSPGFDVHVIANLKIGEYFDFRFLPGVSFTEQKLDFYKFNSTIVDSRKFESVNVELPFHVRYKSEPYKDFRVFIVGGVKYKYDVASNARAALDQSIIRIAPNDFQFEIGAGFQLFFPFFIFSPEFKFSQGLQNSLIFDDSVPESSVIQKVLSRTFTISVHLEG